jgi:microcin C transport system substrate-binding protein
MQRFPYGVFWLALASIAWLTARAEDVSTVHALAMHGEPKYGSDFQHFDYTRPDAPKGGKVKLSAIGTFDTLNPFTLKGVAAADLGSTFDTLLKSSSDEAFTEYGLVAEAIEVPDDRS